MRARVASLAAVLLVAAAMSGRAQAPTFSARVDSVRIDVLVTTGNRPIAGLTREDFEVLDNNVPQVVDFAMFEHMPLNAILVLDLSGSVSGERLGQLRTATRLVVDRLTPTDKAAVITFSQFVNVTAELTGNLADVRSALDSPRIGWNTALVDAAFGALMLGAADTARPLILIFSDGLDTASWLTPAAVLDSAKRSEAVVCAVSTGRTGRRSFLDALADQTGGEVVNLESTRNLAATFVHILDEFRQRYLISYTPRGVSRTGWHDVRIRVKDRMATVKARPGYLVGS